MICGCVVIHFLSKVAEMRSEFKIMRAKSLRYAALYTALMLPLLCSEVALAAKVGHGRVVSAPGQPLQISLPILGLNAQDQQVLQVKVAPEVQWSKAGLTSPVALDSLTITLRPGQSADAREVLISSNQISTRSPVDILLDLTTATGASLIQSSYLVLLPADLAVIGQYSATNTSRAGPMRVSTGDTLYGIAQRHAVSGADVYQTLLAIFEANPSAFISENMNLLRSGANLTIPDADVIRGIDAQRARRVYQAHLSAFNQRRGAARQVGAVPVVIATTSKQAGAVTPPTPRPVEPLKTDQLLLSASTADAQRADARVSAAKEIEELQSRIQSLQSNVNALKETLGEPSAGSPGSAGSTTPSADAVSVQSVSSAATGAAPGSVAMSGTSNPAAANSTVADVGSAQTQSEKSSTAASNANAVMTDSTAVNASDKSKNTSNNVLDQLADFLARNILAAFTALIALSALVIAWVLRRAGSRRDDDYSDDPDATTQASPAMRSAFDQKLQTISLDLGDASPLKPSEPSLRKPD